MGRTHTETAYPNGVRAKAVNRFNRRWTEAREQLFFDELAASANVSRAARVAGVAHPTPYKRRWRDPAFGERWDAALAVGYARIEGAVIRKAIAVVEGRVKAAKAVELPMTFRDAVSLLGKHRERVTTGKRRRSHMKIAPDPEAARAAILKKVEAYKRARIRRELADGMCFACGGALSETARAEREAGIVR